MAGTARWILQITPNDELPKYENRHPSKEAAHAEAERVVEARRRNGDKREYRAGMYLDGDVGEWGRSTPCEIVFESPIG